MFMVWVLRGPNGTEYIVGEDAVPPPERIGEVIARIGPIAYEEGQGLERYKDRIAEDVETVSREREKEGERQQMLAIVRREVEARMPPPPAESPETQPGDAGK